MIPKTETGQLRMIPVDKVEVLNSRERNAKIFAEIVESIKNVGLKKPISVTSRKAEDGTEKFYLICGEGRLKAFKLLKGTQIPAYVSEETEHNAYIKSLNENIARLKRNPIYNLGAITDLQEKGYSPVEIARKTSLSDSYVSGILTLIKHGEDRLLAAVENKHIPIAAALSIVGAGDDDKAMQAALQDAYESGKLRGKKLHEVRRIIEVRRKQGRGLEQNNALEKKKEITTTALVRTYQREVEKQKLMIRKADHVQNRLMFVTGALRELFSDDNFSNLLRAEGLNTLPAYLSQRVWPQGSAL